MENATDALKMAFAVFVFIIALSISFYLLTQSKETADTVLFNSDKTNYYGHMEGSSTEYGREVGVDTILATLMKYQYENVVVKVDDKIYGYPVDFTEIEEFKDANLGKNDIYIETIQVVTTEGRYRVADDGTKITVDPNGRERVYIIYTKKV